MAAPHPPYMYIRSTYSSQVRKQRTVISVGANHRASSFIIVTGCNLLYQGWPDAGSGLQCCTYIYVVQVCNDVVQAQPNNNVSDLYRELDSAEGCLKKKKGEKKGETKSGVNNNEKKDMARSL